MIFGVIKRALSAKKHQAKKIYFLLETTQNTLSDITHTTVVTKAVVTMVFWQKVWLAWYIFVSSSNTKPASYECSHNRIQYSV